jgi:hypothetical protein
MTHAQAVETMLPPTSLNATLTAACLYWDKGEIRERAETLAVVGEQLPEIRDVLQELIGRYNQTTQSPDSSTPYRGPEEFDLSPSTRFLDDTFVNIDPALEANDDPYRRLLADLAYRYFDFSEADYRGMQHINGREMREEAFLPMEFKSSCEDVELC